MASGPQDPRSEEWSPEEAADHEGTSREDASHAPRTSPPTLHHLPPGPVEHAPRTTPSASPWALPPFSAPIPEEPHPGDGPPAEAGGEAPDRPVEAAGHEAAGHEAAGYETAGRETIEQPPGKQVYPPVTPPTGGRNPYPPPSPPSPDRPREGSSASESPSGASSRRMVNRPDKLVATGPPRPPAAPPPRDESVSAPFPPPVAPPAESDDQVGTTWNPTPADAGDESGSGPGEGARDAEENARRGEGAGRRPGRRRRTADGPPDRLRPYQQTGEQTGAADRTGSGGSASPYEDGYIRAVWPLPETHAAADPARDPSGAEPPGDAPGRDASGDPGGAGSGESAGPASAGDTSARETKVTWGSRERETPDEESVRRIGAPPGGRPARPAVLAGLGPPRQRRTRAGQRGGRGRHHREDPRPPRRRGGRGLLTPVLAVLVLVIAAGLGFAAMSWLSSSTGTGVRLAAGDGTAADEVFPAHPGAAGSGSSQVLTAVTSVGSTVVAVGGDTTGPLPRPLFLVSTDGGATWELGRVNGTAGYAARVGTAGLVAGGGGRWLAAGTDAPASGGARGASLGLAGGTGAPGRGIWISTDGRDWTAVDPAKLSMFWPGDRIADLARTAYGFVAVGTTTLSDGRTGPVAWVSPDGENWQRVESGDIAPPENVRGIRAAVAKGDQVVALADPGQGDGTSLILRSPDGGRHWLRTAEALAQVRPEPGALAVAGDGFLLVPTRQNNGGKVTVYCSAEGAAWRGCGSIGPLGADSTGVRGLAYSAAGVAAVAETSWQKYTVFTSGNGTEWDKGAELGTVPGILRGLAITDEGTFVAGGDERVGDVDNLPILLTARKGERARAVPLADITGLTRPARETTRVAAAERLFVAVGSARGDAGIWTSDDGTGWKTVGGAALGGAGRQALADVAHGPRGWLAVGSTMSDPVVTGPLLVTSRDGERWRRVETPDALAVPRGSRHLAPHAVAAGPKGYVIAGEERSGEGGTAALWFTDDLRRYQRAGELPSGGAGVRLHDVAATSAGYVAVGGSGTADRETGVAWVSGDGRNWTARPRVMPDGARSAGLRRVVATATGLVAVGTAVTDDGRRPFAAVSADDGRTWEYSWLPADTTAAALDLTVAGTTLIAVGSHGPPGGGDSVAWISDDGRDWHLQTLEETGLTGEGTQWLGTVAVLGDRVVALGRSTTYTADHLTLWRTTVSR